MAKKNNGKVSKSRMKKPILKKTIEQRMDAVEDMVGDIGENITRILARLGDQEEEKAEVGKRIFLIREVDPDDQVSEDDNLYLTRTIKGAHSLCWYNCPEDALQFNTWYDAVEFLNTQAETQEGLPSMTNKHSFPQVVLEYV